MKWKQASGGQTALGECLARLCYTRACLHHTRLDHSKYLLNLMTGARSFFLLHEEGTVDLLLLPYLDSGVVCPDSGICVVDKASLVSVGWNSGGGAVV